MPAKQPEKLAQAFVPHFEKFGRTFTRLLLKLVTTEIRAVHDGFAIVALKQEKLQATVEAGLTATDLRLAAIEAKLTAASADDLAALKGVTDKTAAVAAKASAISTEPPKE